MLVELKEGTFELVNEQKVDRALNGAPMQNGLNKGGVKKEDGSFDPLTLITEYDKMVGLIKKGGDKLKHGCFFDFKAKKPRVTPEIVFVYRVNNKEIEVKEGVELPGIVKAARLLEQDLQDEQVEDEPKRKSKRRR